MHCASCLKQLPEDATFCMYCGNLVEARQAEVERNKLKTAIPDVKRLKVYPKIPRPVGYLLIGTLIVIPILLLTFQMYREAKERQELHARYQQQFQELQAEYQKQMETLRQELMRQQAERERLQELQIENQKHIEILQKKLEMQRAEHYKQQEILRQEMSRQNLRRALQELDVQMRNVAYREAKRLHQASNVSACRLIGRKPSDESELLAGLQAEVQSTYECRLVGAILGIDRFVVLIQVTGRVIRRGDDFETDILHFVILDDRRE